MSGRIEACKNVIGFPARGGGPGRNELGSPPALEPQEVTAKFFLPIHSPLSFMVFRCSLFLLSFCVHTHTHTHTHKLKESRRHLPEITSSRLQGPQLSYTLSENGGNIRRYEDEIWMESSRSKLEYFLLTFFVYFACLVERSFSISVFICIDIYVFLGITNSDGNPSFKFGQVLTDTVSVTVTGTQMNTIDFGFLHQFVHLSTLSATDSFIRACAQTLIHMNDCTHSRKHLGLMINHTLQWPHTLNY